MIGTRLRAPLARADLPCGLVAVHDRHLAVHENDVISAGLPCGNRVLAHCHDVDLVAHLLQTCRAPPSDSPGCPRPAGCAAPCNRSRLRLAITMGCVRSCHCDASTDMARAQALAQFAMRHRFEEVGRKPQLPEILRAADRERGRQQNQPRSLVPLVAWRSGGQAQTRRTPASCIEHGEIERRPHMDVG